MRMDEDEDEHGDKVDVRIQIFVWRGDIFTRQFLLQSRFALKSSSCYITKFEKKIIRSRVAIDGQVTSEK